MNIQAKDGTVVSLFTGWNEFQKKTIKFKILIEIAGIGWYLPSNKKSIKQVYDSMSKNGMKSCFQGKITYVNGIYAQVKFNTI